MRFDAYGHDMRLGEVGPLAREARRVGFSTIWFTESRHNPFLSCAVAAEAEQGIGTGTAIAVAFPRSPMVTAQAAWDLADQTAGQFELGLGTQVKAHITRRFSAPWAKPVPQMREYIAALRAIFRAFQGQEPLSFKGDFHSFSLLPDAFSPGPIAHPDVPIQIAGVNAGLARLAGETCDGFHVHPFHSREYLTEIVRPAVDEGARRAGRSIDDISFITPVFMVVGDTEEERATQLASVRSRLSFYASTPTYAPVLEHHGFADLAPELQRLVRSGDHDAMAALMTDAVIAPFCVIATWDELPQALRSRYEGVTDSIVSYLSPGSWTEDAAQAERWAAVIEQMRTDAS